MSLATSQTFSRTNLREFSFTTDVIRKKVIDHVFNHSPATAIFGNKMLGEFGGVQLRGVGHTTQSGGHAVLIRVRLGEHAGAGRSASGFGTHNVAPDDNTRLAECNWKFYNHGLTVSTHDLRINKGAAAISSFLADQTESVMLALVNMLGDDLYAATIAPNAITSLDDLIAANDSVQGLSGADYANWNSRGLSLLSVAAGSKSFASGSFAAQGIADMRTLVNNASEGMIGPNAMLTDYASHERYEGALQPLERFQGAVRVADASFSALAFRTIPVMPDRKCNAGFMYAVNAGEQGIQLIVLEGADFEWGEWKPSSNQNVMVRPMELTAQLCIKNRSYGNNKMTGITD